LRDSNEGQGGDRVDELIENLARLFGCSALLKT